MMGAGKKRAHAPRIALFDNLKGILIVLVVFGHIAIPVQNDTPSLSLLFDIIYLFHTTFEGFAKAVFRKLPLDPGLWYVFAAEAAVAVAIGIVAPVLLHRLLMKHRATRLLFGL